jgi:hypothetical protein
MDDADRSDPMIEAVVEDGINEAHRRAQLDPGEPGECVLCGDEHIRLVRGRCPRCRDQYGEGK